MPDNAIVQALIKELGNPVVSTSIHSEDEIQEYLTEPEEIYQNWMHKVDFIVDGGAGSNIGTTVIDASEGVLTIIREGKGIELI